MCCLIVRISAYTIAVAWPVESAAMLLQHRLKLGNESRYIVLCRIPYSIPNHLLKAMNQAVTHTNNAMPINLRDLSVCGIVYLPRRLANQLDRLCHCVVEQ